MPRAKPTALSVERAQKSGNSVLLSDGDGLYLREQTGDGASWTLRHSFASRQHWLTLGNYPDMPLAQWTQLLLDAEHGESKVAPLRRRQLTAQP